jgi:hypothetical protein
MKLSTSEFYDDQMTAYGQKPLSQAPAFHVRYFQG